MQYRWKKSSRVLNNKCGKQGIISISIDACQNLCTSLWPESSLYPKVKISINDDLETAQETAICNKTSNPLFSQSFLLEYKDYTTDTINIRVINSRNKECLGNTKISLGHVFEFENHEISQSVHTLENGINTEAAVTVTAKLYFIETE